MADGDDFGQGIAVQRDGKILLAGGSAGGDYSVLRVLPDGTPDPGFGKGGKVVQDFGLFELARSVVQLADDRILVGGAGLVYGGSRDFAALCLLPNGTPDPGYGTGGLATTDINGGYNEVGNCMVVDTGGRATLGGSHRGNIAMVRFTATGTLDPSFGAGGKVYSTVIPTTEEQIQALAFQPDGRLVAAVLARSPSKVGIVVARYLDNGTLDPDFGSGGRVVAAVGVGSTVDIPQAVTVRPNGKILVAGSSADDYLLLQFLANGSLDPDFGTQGIVTVGFQNATDSGYGVAVQRDGKVLVAGTSTLGGRDYFGLLRFLPGGALDTGFAGGGGTLLALTAGTDSARAVALQSDGKILVGGYAGPLGGRDFAFIRYDGGDLIPLPAWRQAHFQALAGTADAADDADFDHDGVANLLEYAFGQDPTSAASHALPAGQFRDGQLGFRFVQPSEVVGITYGADVSATLAPGSWTPVADSGSGSLHQFAVPVVADQPRFLRLRVSAP
jgi:uncharacterized delta-60 repeat protein